MAGSDQHSGCTYWYSRYVVLIKKLNAPHACRRALSRRGPREPTIVDRRSSGVPIAKLPITIYSHEYSGSDQKNQHSGSLGNLLLFPSSGRETLEFTYLREKNNDTMIIHLHGHLYVKNLYIIIAHYFRASGTDMRACRACLKQTCARTAGKHSTAVAVC